MIEFNGNKYYTLSEVASLFDISKRTVCLWRKKRILIGKEINSKKFIYSQEEIERLLGK
jgi:DNA-binding transcriptional MerR regulator